jgi:hypothetical protein
MTEIIAALQEEIAAAQRKRHETLRQLGVGETAGDPAQEPLPFTAENGDCTFMENGDLR